MKAKMVMVATVGLALQAFPAVSVSNIVCRQHYPWNGLVDIDYEVFSDDPSATYWVYPKGEDKRMGKRVIMHTLSGDGATNAVTVGKHRMVWDAKADMPKFMTTDLQVTLQVIANAAPYLVVDVSGGPNAVYYPIRYSAVGPDLSDDKCRTDEIWLKFILPGTFMMGSPTNEWGRADDETLHKVVLTKPYYMCVFEVTAKQWYNVMGGEMPTAWDGKDCIAFVSSTIWADVRGGSWPSSHVVGGNTFLDRIRKRTNLTWELPTEAQWEHACRAGTTTSLNTGKEVSSNECEAMSEVGRYRGNGGGTQWSVNFGKPGLYCPNNWGLYDMHGNAPEICLDLYNEGTYLFGTYEEFDNVTDPVGWPTGSQHTVRGGTANSWAGECRSAARKQSSSEWTGFRPVVLPFD